MNTENELKPTAQPTHSKRYVRAKHSRKKKFAVFIIVAGVSAFGTLAYLNKSADPTTWETIRTDYKNTK